MPITNNPQQLLLVKQLYDDASSLAGRNDELSLTKALILMDLSVEHLLNQVIRDCSLNTTANTAFGRKDVGWQKIWETADNSLKEIGFGLIHHRMLIGLHEVRNLAQHNATIPTQNEVQRYIPPTKEMIQKVFTELYGQEFENFTLWDLIENDDLRKLLVDSEYALNKNKPEVCIFGCSIVHDQLIEAVRLYTKKKRFRVAELLPFHRYSHLSLSRYNAPSDETKKLVSDINIQVTELQKQIIQEIEFLENEIVTVGIGLPIMDTRKFQTITQWLSFTKEKYTNLIVKVFIDDELTRGANTVEAARFTLSYLFRLIYLIDESYPKIIQDIQIGLSLEDFAFWEDIKQ